MHGQFLSADEDLFLEGSPARAADHFLNTVQLVRL
jgi:hypothetical protein